MLTFTFGLVGVLHVRESTRANRHYIRDGWYPGDITGKAGLGVRDHDFIGTSQTTRDICSRTADALTNKSLSLSLSLSIQARDRTTPHACVHYRRVREPGKVKTSRRVWENSCAAASVGCALLQRRELRRNAVATRVLIIDSAATAILCCEALLSTMINICETCFDVKKSVTTRFSFAICIAESKSEIIIGCF